jgi:electron transfer flavoprotein alpha/beta subunit
MIVEIVVCIKQIFDLNQIREDATTKRPVTEGVTRKISDFDKNELEEGHGNFKHYERTYQHGQSSAT